MDIDNLQAAADEAERLGRAVVALEQRVEKLVPEDKIMIYSVAESVGQLMALSSMLEDLAAEQQEADAG